MTNFYIYETWQHKPAEKILIINAQLMDELLKNLDKIIQQITDQYNIRNLIAVQTINYNEDYWSRLSRLSFFEKLWDDHRYHFLYEIQSLSCQIHFGIAKSILYRDNISVNKGMPNMYNHRYTFMVESTIHGIYSYWNRVALVLNTYLEEPKDLKKVYFASIVRQLLVDYPDLKDYKNYRWIKGVQIALEELDRNEFTHNNSLIMQNFIPKNTKAVAFENLLHLPDTLIEHNKLIVDDVFRLVDLLETLENLYNSN